MAGSMADSRLGEAAASGSGMFCCCCHGPAADLWPAHGCVFVTSRQLQVLNPIWLAGDCR